MDFTCDAAAEEGPDEDRDQSGVFGELSVMQGLTLRTMEHGAAAAKWLFMEML